LDSQLNIWYLDDEILADYPEVVLSDFKKVINLSRKIGFELNFNKCEIFCCSGDTDLKVIKEFQNLAPGIKICDRGSLSLLGSPIFDQGFKNTVEKTIITVANLLNKAGLLSRHVAYTLTKNCLFMPKFNFLLRTTPFLKCSNYVNSTDFSLKSSLEKILNLRLTDLYNGVSPLYRLDLVDWEFAAFPIFASMLSYLQFMVLKSCFSITKFKG
jgi:hypothetical protein